MIAARWAVRLLAWANVACAIGFLVALIASVPFGSMIEARLVAKYGAGFDVATLVTILRLMLALGIAASLALWIILDRLSRMLKTVEAGDPFVRANARRLQAIGWALLALQFVELGFGGLVRWLDALGADSGAGWQPSVMGWIAVLLVFVLARIFAVGSAMRDDLEGTV
ncbi:DUF2975 domain-containing protein [Sphingomonas sp. ST-64]|uniref:DUF2975 domain-containing protein n=1 Tax=Sphingomonas plantiphila TaxID=3163295 RepID=A0ABW8YQA2_9SPHN